MITFSHKAFNELSPKELYDILWLRQYVFVVEQNCVYLDTDGKDLYARHVMGYNKDGIILACGRVLEDPKWPNYISYGRICTHPHYRGKGLGKKLMDQLFLVGRDFFPDKPIKIGAQKYLEKFYKDFGFNTESAPYLEDGIPHIDMVKKI